MKKYPLLLILLTLTVWGRAQMGSTMLQYAGNQMVYNPSYAGLYDFMALNLSARKHWAGLPGSPTLVSLNGYAPLKRQQHAVGLVVQREEWGAFTGLSGYANYAHKIYFDRSILSFGLQAGFLNHVTDWDKVEFFDRTDPVVGTEGRVSNTVFDANVGAFFQREKFYIGLSVKHLTHPRINISKDTTNSDWHEQINSQYYFFIGHHFELNRDWALRPEVFLRHIPNESAVANLGLLASYSRHFFGIHWLPVQKSVSFTAKIAVSNQFEVSYTYDTYYSKIRPYQNGSHEVSIHFYVSELWGD